MEWIRSLGARAHGRGRQVAVAGALAGAAALAVGVAAMASGPDDGAGRASPAAEAAAPTPAAPATTVVPAISPPVASARVAPVAPLTSVPPAPATPAAVSGDTGDEYGEYGDYGEYGEYGECGDYGDAGDESVPTEEPVFEALPDGRYAASLVSMNTDAGVVGLDVLDLLVDPDGGRHFSNPESRVRLMYMTSDVELTGVVPPPSPNVYWATVEGGFVTALEPAS